MWHWLLELAYHHALGGALLKVGVDACSPTVHDMHVRNNGGTDAHGVGREVHVCSARSMSQRHVAFCKEERLRPRR